MRISKILLKQIIKEEVEAAIAEQGPGGDQQLLNRAMDLIRSKIRTLPGPAEGHQADLAYMFLTPLADEAYRLHGPDRENVLQYAGRIGDHLVEAVGKEIDEEGNLDPRVLNFYVKSLVKHLKKMTPPGDEKKTAERGRPRPGISTAQGELKKGDVTFELRQEGGYFVATAKHKSGVSVEGKAKLRGNRNLAKESAMARARDALIRKLQGK